MTTSWFVLRSHAPPGDCFDGIEPARPNPEKRAALIKR